MNSPVTGGSRPHKVLDSPVGGGSTTVRMQDPESEYRQAMITMKDRHRAAASRWVPTDECHIGQPFFGGMLSALTRLRATSPERIGLAAGLVTVTMWGSGFVAIRAADRWFSPGTIGLGRLIVSCLVLAVVAMVRRDPLPPR